MEPKGRKSMEMMDIDEEGAMGMLPPTFPRAVDKVQPPRKLVMGGGLSSMPRIVERSESRMSRATQNEAGRVTRENTKTSILSHGVGGRKTATLFLSRPASIMRHSQCASRQSRATRLPPVHSRASMHTPSSEASRQSSPRPEIAKEFTFTGYDIMADVSAGPTPVKDNDEAIRQHHLNLYMQACKHLTITPLTVIANAITDPRITIRTRTLGAKGAKALAIALVENPKVHVLDMHDNGVGSEGVTAIADMLSANFTITELDLSQNEMGTTGIRELCNVVKENSFLRKLDISGNKLFDHDAMYVAEIIECNVILRELRASHNKFGSIGGTYLGPAIANNDTIELLDLSWNHLRGQGAMAVVAGLKDNGGLKTFDLSWNGVSKEGCNILGMSLATNSVLKELNLSCNRLQTEAIGGLLKALQTNDTLITLKLGKNPITPDVAALVLRAILKSETCVVQDVDLTDVVVDREFFKVVEEIRAKRPFNVKTGNVITKGEKLDRESDGIILTFDPMQALFEFLTEKGYRAIDLFKRFNAERTMTVTRDEFQKGVLGAHVPLTVGQLEDLMDVLDVKRTGDLDIKIIIEEEKVFRRKQLRKKLKDAAGKRRGTLPDVVAQVMRRRGSKASSVGGEDRRMSISNVSDDGSRRDGRRGSVLPEDVLVGRRGSQAALDAGRRGSIVGMDGGRGGMADQDARRGSITGHEGRGGRRSSVTFQEPESTRRFPAGAQAGQGGRRPSITTHDAQAGSKAGAPGRDNAQSSRRSSLTGQDLRSARSTKKLEDGRGQGSARGSSLTGQDLRSARSSKKLEAGGGHGGSRRSSLTGQDLRSARSTKKLETGGQDSATTEKLPSLPMPEPQTSRVPADGSQTERPVSLTKPGGSSAKLPGLDGNKTTRRVSLTGQEVQNGKPHGAPEEGSQTARPASNRGDKPPSARHPGLGSKEPTTAWEGGDETEEVDPSMEVTKEDIQKLTAGRAASSITMDTESLAPTEGRVRASAASMRSSLVHA